MNDHIQEPEYMQYTVKLYTARESAVLLSLKSIGIEPTKQEPIDNGKVTVYTFIEPRFSDAFAHVIHQVTTLGYVLSYEVSLLRP